MIEFLKEGDTGSKDKTKRKNWPSCKKLSRNKKKNMLTRLLDNFLAENGLKQIVNTFVQNGYDSGNSAIHNNEDPQYNHSYFF